MAQQTQRTSADIKPCTACLHYLGGACTHPQSPRHYVTGESTRACWMRQAKNQPDGICGPSGRLFEPLPSTHVGQPGVDGIGQHARLSSEQAVSLLLGNQARLPDHFETFTAVQVYDYFLQHGVECTLDFAAQLQRDLAAQKFKDGELGACTEAHNKKALGSVQGDDGSGVHGGSVDTPLCGGAVARTAILSMPAGSGTTAMAPRIAQFLGCSSIVKEWSPGQPIVAGALHLTNADLEGGAA